MHYKVWEDGQEPLFVQAQDMNQALDLAAIELGCVDYADLAQERGWSESEGLNIALEIEPEN